MLSGKNGGKDLLLNIPFGTDGCEVRKKVALRGVMCCILYLNSVYHKKVTRELMEYELHVYFAIISY